VLPKLRAFTGGRLRLAVSGGGSLPRHVDETLLGIGLPLLNGYGLTETSPVASVRLPERNGPGTIGPPLPNTAIEARDADGRKLPPGQTGILWIKGPQVMRGYYQNPERTAAVLDGGGWFNTGDLGYVDAGGQVWITGRAKDTIVLAGGENVEPEPIEAAIKTSPLVEQAVVVGQDQKLLGALLVPSFDCLEKAVPKAQWDAADGQLRGKPVLELYRRELDRLVARETGFRAVDRIAGFAVLLEPLTPENGLLTQTLKVKRHVVHERFAGVIAALFA
jgi:long-chain acyl-CoA synthetase